MTTRFNKNKLLQSKTTIKAAAIWARVSTHDQREASLPNQIDRCKELLKLKSYTVTHTFSADWTSFDLYSCPAFQELRNLIRNREIKALAVFDRDRLEAQGLQRLVFLSECREAGVKLEICQGPPTLDDPEGQIVELALAVGKERQVLRARQGSKDGLHNRVLKLRLPTSRHKLYGYKWVGERRLEPDEDWPNVKLIFDMLLQGSAYWPIIEELKKRGILSPQGLAQWNKAGISNIVHNPSYAGRYYALRKQAVAPIKRNGNTYGNSSQKKLSLDESHYISEIEIVNPPVTWEQRLQILGQLAEHQKLAQRNAKRDYLLRGIIFCGAHTGKKGEPRIFHGQPHHGSWRYTCPVGGCSKQYINGPLAETFIKEIIKTLFRLQPSRFYKAITGRRNIEKLEQRLHGELISYDRKYDRKLRKEADLEDRFLSGNIDEMVYAMLKNRYRVERQGIEKRKREVISELAQIGREKEAVASIREIRKKVYGRIDILTTTEWRQLFSMLNVKVYTEEMVSDTFEKVLPKEIGASIAVPNDRGKLPFVMTINVPLQKAEVEKIVLDSPAPG